MKILSRLKTLSAENPFKQFDVLVCKTGYGKIRNARFYMVGEAGSNKAGLNYVKIGRMKENMKILNKKEAELTPVMQGYNWTNKVYFVHIDKKGEPYIEIGGGSVAYKWDGKPAKVSVEEEWAI